MDGKTNELHLYYEKPNINDKQLKIMVFLMNALEKGWCIKKKENEFIFTKKHEGKKEIFNETYLEEFIQSNFDMDVLKHN